jgi:eukaryotic-like serine/threonine-protein kinase
MTWQPGSRLGPYEIGELLGAGAMGEVYRARDTNLGRDAAIKILPASLVDDPDRLARFRREAQVLASFNHPHIAAVYGWEESGGQSALIMELVKGRPLSELIPRHGLKLSDALTYAVGIAAGIEAAHRAGIIHRDLKPANVMITEAGGVKLLDFGLARSGPPVAERGTAVMTQTAGPGTAEGTILGTVAYMSPEQAQGLDVDARSDIFGFGAVLYEMLSGRRPFQRDNQVSTLAAILREEPPSPSAARGEPLPPDAERIVLKCLRKDPARRFQTASDLRVALEDVRDEISSGAFAVPPARSGSRMAKWMPAIGGAVVIVAALASFLVWRARDRGPSAAAAPLRQLTFEAGMALMPALSADGKLLAYVSDRAGDGVLDLWITQVAGGDPVRLVSGIGSVTNPQFSADATKIYFLGPDNTIFEVPALGGSPRRLVERAGPFSVSSRGEIAFVRPKTGGRANVIQIVPAGGGEPQAWSPDCVAGHAPAWSPDGQRLAFFGGCNIVDQAVGSALLIGRRDGQPTQIALKDLPRDAPGVSPSQWSQPAWFTTADGREGLVAAWRRGETVNLHEIFFDGSSRPITLGTGWETWPSVSASGQIVFSRSEGAPTIWSLPHDTGGVVPTPRQEVKSASLFSTSRDGQTVVFARALGALKGELRARNMATGAEVLLDSTVMALGSVGSFWSTVSADGRQAVYRMLSDHPIHFIVATDGGAPRQLQQRGDFNMATDWLAGGTAVLGECFPFVRGLCSMRVTDGVVTQLLKDPQGGELLSPTLSWDGRWVSFMRRRAGKTVIWMAPVRAGEPVAFGEESTWIQISAADGAATRPRFTPDGLSLYYMIGVRGVLTLLRQPLDPGTMRPAGPFVVLAPVQMFPTALNYSVGGSNAVLGVSRDRVFFNTLDVRANVWMTSVQ